MTSDIQTRVGEEVIDELRNYKGFRHWYDNWDEQEVLIESVGNTAIKETLTCFIEQAEKGLFSERELAAKWLKHKLNELES